MRLEDKLRLDRFTTEEESHLRIMSPEICRRCSGKPCTFICCVETYRWENDQIIVRYERCLECGACKMVCRPPYSPAPNISWTYPKGGYGVQYKYG